MISFHPTTSLAIAIALVFLPLPGEAAVYKCEVVGKTAYQATPCHDGHTRAIPAPTPAPQSTSKAGGPSAGNPTCQGEELSLHFQTTPLPMVLQVIADFSGRRAQIDPSVTGNPPIQYVCTPWRAVLKDIAQRHQLDIRIENQQIFVRRR